MTAPQTINVPAGMVILTTYGTIQADTAHAYAEMRVRAQQLGLTQISWPPPVHGALVDKARNEAVRMLLADPKQQWLWMLDGDMLWQPHLVDQILSTAYGECPDADMIGAWCPLRSHPFMPTIDTGTGTWEPVAPGQGPINVIRTGAACVLVKRHVYEKMRGPWYGIRNAMRPLDALLEFDNYARIKFDGRNPFKKLKEWGQLQGCAEQDAQSGQPDGGVVGEDSGFSDRAKALGFRIIVQTNAVCCHIDRHVITPEDHVKAMQELRDRQALASGVLT